MLRLKLLEYLDRRKQVIGGLRYQRFMCVDSEGMESVAIDVMIQLNALQRLPAPNLSFQVAYTPGHSCLSFLSPGSKSGAWYWRRRCEQTKALLVNRCGTDMMA